MNGTASQTLLPIWCGEIELSDPEARVVPTAPARTTRVLARLDGEPLAYVQRAGNAPWSAAGVVAELIPAQAESVVARWSSAPRTPVLRDVVATESVTVVVCTRDRGPALRQCLDGLSRLQYPRLEIVVVDNAPSDGTTRTVVLAAAAEDPRIRYVVEPAPGLSRARNTGLRAARGTIVAFTDDDVRVDPWWIHGLSRGFARRADVVCVTGLASAASLDSPVEAYFDSRVSWSTLRPATVHDRSGAGHGPLYPFAAGLFGTGANFAVRRDVMAALGGFDERLGAGAATRGGEDLDAFVRILLADHAIAFEPSALVWHHHRSTVADLRRQMYGYGTGLAAMYVKYLTERATRGQVLRRVPAGFALLLHRMRPAAPTERQPVPTTGGTTAIVVPAPRGLLRAELRGLLDGPRLWWRATRQAPAPQPWVPTVPIRRETLDVTA